MEQNFIHVFLIVLWMKVDRLSEIIYTSFTFSNGLDITAVVLPGVLPVIDLLGWVFCTTITLGLVPVMK